MLDIHFLKLVGGEVSQCVRTLKLHSATDSLAFPFGSYFIDS